MTSRTGDQIGDQKPSRVARISPNHYVEQAAAEGETVTLTAKPRMMTPEEVAEAMGVSRPTISRKIKAGEIREVKVGNRNRIPYEEFERYWRQTMGDLVELTRDEILDDLFDP